MRFSDFIDQTRFMEFYTFLLLRLRYLVDFGNHITVNSR